MGGSDVEMESDEGREERRRRKRDRSRSKDKDRSRSKDRERRKHKKHKKEKKKHRRKDRNSSDEDTGNEGGDTPQKNTESEALSAETEKLPGLGKYDSEEDGEIAEKNLNPRADDGNEKSAENEKKEFGRDKDRRRRKSRSRSKERNRSGSRDERGRGSRKEENRDSSKRDKQEQKDVYANDGGSKDTVSLSVDETNKLRAKLGLKPLNITAAVNVDENPDLPGTLIPGDRDKTRHLAPEHWGERDRSKKLREKLAIGKEKRQLKSKLSVVKTLGDSDSDDDAAKWIEKQKKKTQLKEEAEKRARAMDSMEAEFGVGEIVEEGIREKQQQEYLGRDLKGMRVEHSAEHFTEATTILTLQDQDILDDKYEDVLVNVNIIDAERTKKSIENIKAGKEGYQAYGTEEVDEMTGEVKKKQLLYQYNEEIEGVKKDSFTLEGDGQFSEELNKERELAKIRQKLKLNNTVSLATPSLKLAADYYTEQEMVAFKKPKKKKKIKKKILKADDLLAMQDEGNAQLPAEMVEKQKNRRSRIIDDDQMLPDGRLPGDVVFEDTKLDNEAKDDSKALKALKLKALVASKLSKNKKSVDNVAEEILRDSRENTVEMEDENASGTNFDDLVIDQTKEFCRGLGEGGSYEMSGMAGEVVDKDLLDFERGLESKRMKSAMEWSKMEEKEDIMTTDEPKKPSRGKWEEVETDEVEEGKWKEGAVGKRQRRKGKDNSNAEEGSKASYRPAILDDEALAATGMGAALRMAQQKGYLDAEEKAIKSHGLVNLVCKDYKIEDKSRDHEEDDRKRRGGGRDRGYSGPTSSFQEKKGYKPQVSLEYIDDNGRAMSQKEAFRFLSHKFHGKGSGKLKTEKRYRKVMEEKLMEKMNSTDTPLNTLEKLQAKTKEMASPYIVLSGNKDKVTSLKK